MLWQAARGPISSSCDGPHVHNRYLLKNRVYLGEVHHGGKWFKAEHDAVLDQNTFEQVQSLLKANAIDRKASCAKNGALLQGKLFNDRGNRMGPSFCSKNGVRYRFYVSRALRGRKHTAGTVTRISAPEIEAIVETAVRDQMNGTAATREETLACVERVVATDRTVRIVLGSSAQSKDPIEIPWVRQTSDISLIHPTLSETKTDPKLLQAVVRAHVWLNGLHDGRHASIYDLAAASRLHPKVVRQGLRLAFRSPATTSTILDGQQHLKLKQIPKSLPLAWSRQSRPRD